MTAVLDMLVDVLRTFVRVLTDETFRLMGLTD
jgi:hypothetical protein